MNPLSGLVIAGGRSTRMGGLNKGLLPWQDGTLVDQALRQLKALADPVYISANQDLDRYALRAEIIEDRRPGFKGPLAAIEAALLTIKTPWLMTLPCDTPWVTSALLKRLSDGIPSDAQAAYFVCGSAIHPLVSLVAQSALPVVTELLDQESLRVMTLWQRLDAVPIDLGVEFEPFFQNLNTPESYQAALRFGKS